MYDILEFLFKMDQLISINRYILSASLVLFDSVGKSNHFLVDAITFVLTQLFYTWNIHYNAVLT